MAPYAEEGCKLFVYGVNENTSNSELSDAFSKYGTVVDTYNTGKGYAFVTFDNKEDAQTATDQLNGQEILGQQVFALVSEERFFNLYGKIFELKLEYLLPYLL